MVSTSSELELVTFHKTVDLVLNAKACRTVGDLVSTLTNDENKPSSFSLNDGSNYFLSGLTGREIPLNGDKYHPEAELPPIEGESLRIDSRPKDEFLITIRRGGMQDSESRPKDFEMIVDRRDLGFKIGQQILDQSSISMPRQILQFNGRRIRMDGYLLQHHVQEHSVITLIYTVHLKFHFRKTESHRDTTSDTPLAKILQDLAKNEGENSGNLRFSIPKATESAKQPVAKWLPNRYSLFSADCPEGTLEENGFVRTGEIYVYSVLPKRKKASDVEEDDSRGGKKQKVDVTTLSRAAS